MLELRSTQITDAGRSSAARFLPALAHGAENTPLTRRIKALPEERRVAPNLWPSLSLLGVHVVDFLFFRSNPETSRPAHA